MVTKVFTLLVQTTDLNDHVGKCGKPGQPFAPIYWNMKGRPEIMTMSVLVAQYKEKQETMLMFPIHLARSPTIRLRNRN